MASTSVGDLFGRLTLDASAFDRAARQVDTSLNRIQASFHETSSSAARAAGGSGVFEERLKRMRPTVTDTAKRLEEIKNELRGTGKEASGAAGGLNTARSSFDSLRSSIVGTTARLVAFVAGYLTFRAALRAGRDIVQTNRELERLEAQLRTMTGGGENAARAFEFIKRFAVTTPFQIDNLTEAFVRLLAFGVEPTEDRMRGLGNIAAGFGRDFSTLTDAIISGVNGMSRPLRQFGVQTSISGKSMKVSFQGVTATIPRTTEALTDFLTNLARTGPLASAMADRMDTLDGAMSNLSDATTIFVGKIGKGGLNAEIANLAREMARATGEGDQLAQTLGEGLAGGVNLASRSLRELVPLLQLGAEFLARFRSEGAQRAEPIIGRITGLEAPRGVTDEILAAHERRADAIRRLNEANKRLSVIPSEQRNVVRFLGEDLARMHDQFNRLLVPPQLQSPGPGQILGIFGLEKQVTDAQADLEAAERVIRAGQSRLRELQSEGGFEPFAQGDLGDLGGLGDSAKQKIDPIADALERLGRSRVEIRDMAELVRGTSVEFNATADTVSALEAAISSLLQEGVGLDTVLNEQGLTVRQLGIEYTTLAGEMALAERRAKAFADEQKRLNDEIDEIARGIQGGKAAQFKRSLEKQLKEQEELAREVADSMAGAFGDAFGSIITGSESVADAISNMVQRILSDLTRIVIRETITAPLASAIVGALSGGGSGVVAARQHGGPLSAGQLALVGERGPELFVPRSAGTVVPNGGSFGGRSEVHYHTHNSYDIRALDSRGVRQVLEQHAGTLNAVNRRQERLRGRG